MTTRIRKGTSLTLLGLDAFVKDDDVETLAKNLKSLLTFDNDFWNPSSEVDEATKQKQKLRRRVLIAALAIVVPLTFFFSSFVVLIPLVHGLGGHLMHKDEGWEFYQPGVGGTRFVALNGLGWTFYGTTIAMQMAHIVLGDFFLVLSAFISGLLSLSLIFSSLFAYQGLNRGSKAQIDETEEPEEMAATVKMFNSRVQRSVLMHSGENPSGLWWVLITLQLSLSLVATWFMVLLASESLRSHSFINAPEAFRKTFQLTTLIIAACCYATSTPVTHAIGGKWKNFNTSFTSFQPFTGGKTFVTLQALGWTFYSMTQVLTLTSFATILRPTPSAAVLLATAIAGITSEALIVSSLFYFEDGGKEFQLQNIDNDIVLKSVIDVMNFIFGPGGNWEEKTRKTTLKNRDDWMKGEEKYQQVLKESGSSQATGEGYLIVGCGFVGKRLVKRLLDRGEQKITIFDLNPNNPFKDVPEVTYVIGDVTKYDQICAALEGIDVIYATFALIRFMDRLPHQAALSYHVNVNGTKVLFQALETRSKERETPLQVIVTSSSHATTDETSLPRKNRDESSPYVTRENAHNHYGWTKALAEKHALEQNSEKLKICVIRPCSGVFGGDDRTSMEKCLDLGVTPGIGSYCEMDWVYVENVVLGHLLAETGLRKEIAGEMEEGSVSGQPFNVSNNDATTWIDFWFLVRDTMKLQFGTNPKKKTLKIEFCFVPMNLLWGIAFCSELIQQTFRGRVSLGADLDSLTPAMLSTATMSYTYGSDKAHKVLGYIPAYSLDEGVQKSVEEYYTLKVDKKPLW